MNWDNDLVLKFLKLYEMNACIWDPRHKFHKNRKMLNLGWMNIQQNMGVRCTIKALKKKKESLMSAYRGYKGKIKRSEVVATDPIEIYKPPWYAFGVMDSFLSPVYTFNGNKNPVEEEEIEDLKTNSPQDSEEDEDTSVEQDCQEYRIQPSTSSPFQHVPDGGKQNSGALKRKYDNLELPHTRNQMNQQFSFVKTVYQNAEDDEECSIFGTLIAKKLRRLPEERRDVLMVKINQLFVDERANAQNSSSNVSPGPASSGDYVITVKESTSPTWHQNVIQFVNPNSEHDAGDAPKRPNNRN